MGVHGKDTDGKDGGLDFGGASVARGALEERDHAGDVKFVEFRLGGRLKGHEATEDFEFVCVGV